MEASQAAGQGQAQAGTGDGGGEAQGQAFDASQIQSQFDSLSQGQQELRDLLGSFQSQAQDAGAGDQVAQDDSADELDLSFLDDQAGYGDPNVVAQQLQQVVSQHVQQAVQAATEPLTKQNRELATRLDASDLVSELPELGDPEVASHTIGLAREMAQVLGQPELADNPKLWRYAYMVGRAAEAANAEGSEQPGAAHLEGGAGATPGGSQVDLGDQIVQAARGGRSVLPFG